MANSRFEKLIPLILLGACLLITLPGIAWGTPSLWHPDELIDWVDKALHGKHQFDTTLFIYPSLPKYVMFGLGKVVYGLGYGRGEFIISARLLSALLGAGIAALVYMIAQQAGAASLGGLLAAGFLLTSSEMALNARLAHNDIYLAFFTVLTVYFTLRYLAWSGEEDGPAWGKLWLYAAFLGVGCAASSKYNGVSLLLAPLVVYLGSAWGEWKVNWLKILETLFIGLALTAAGYVLGTPRALLDFAFYVRQVTTALSRLSQFGRQPGTVLGVVGQWGVLASALGTAVLVLFLAAFLYYAAMVVRYLTSRLPESQAERDIRPMGVILLAVILLDLPMAVAYNYRERFFVPMIPMLAVLAGAFIADLSEIFRQRGRRMAAVGVLTAAGLLIFYSAARLVSTVLLYYNDSRIAASLFVATLPPKTSIEYTLYPPTIPADYFSRRHSYPIRFQKFPDQGERKKGKIYDFNTGEAGLEARGTDYLILDSITYERFDDPFVCETAPVECEFFRRLLGGETNYQLIASFEYHLPKSLPQMAPFFLNPNIQVYERAP